MRLRIFTALVASVQLITSGCAALTAIPENYYEVRRDAVAPLLVVRAEYLPRIDSDFRLRGKGQGTAAGAGTGFAYCALESLATGPFAPLMMTLLCPPMMVAGAVVGATQAEAKEKVVKAEANFDQILAELQTQDRLINEVMRYLGTNGLQATLADVERVPGPTAPELEPSYHGLPYAGYPTLLEVGLQEIRFDSPGTKSLYACLTLKARLRNLELPGNRVRQSFTYRQSAGCRPVEEWLRQGSDDFPRILEQAFGRLVEIAIDELFLMYHPQPLVEGASVTTPPLQDTDVVPALHERLVPAFALRPVSPPLKEPGLNILTAFTNKKRGILHGFGGLQFTDVDSLTPAFVWESFPRPQDVAHADGTAAAFSDVTYDFRLFNGAIGLGNVVGPRDVVYERTGLTRPEHQLDTPLDHCQWYFWTVRARFKLFGASRVTEWSGIFHSLGGKVYPASYRRDQESLVTAGNFGEKLYFPIRTPASKQEPACWD